MVLENLVHQDLRFLQGAFRLDLQVCLVRHVRIGTLSCGKFIKVLDPHFGSFLWSFASWTLKLCLVGFALGSTTTTSVFEQLLHPLRTHHRSKTQMLRPVETTSSLG